jgi:hypothetical protein
VCRQQGVGTTAHDRAVRGSRRCAALQAVPRSRHVLRGIRAAARTAVQMPQARLTNAAYRGPAHLKLMPDRRLNSLFGTKARGATTTPSSAPLPKAAACDPGVGERIACTAAVYGPCDTHCSEADAEKLQARSSEGHAAVSMSCWILRRDRHSRGSQQGGGEGGGGGETTTCSTQSQLDKGRRIARGPWHLLCWQAPPALKAYNQRTS